MKWYAYPLAIIAWLLIAIWLFLAGWNYISSTSLPGWHYWFWIVAGSYIVSSFILSRFKLSWELDAFLQVALVLGPLLWYLNQRPAYKPPVYVFLIEAGYEGDAQVSFSTDESTETKVRSTADTLYFKFNGQGRILLNEDFIAVREAISSRFYHLYPDGTQKKINVVAEGATVAADSTSYIAYEDTVVSENGQMRYITWKISRADKYEKR